MYRDGIFSKFGLHCGCNRHPSVVGHFHMVVLTSGTRVGINIAGLAENDLNCTF